MATNTESAAEISTIDAAPGRPMPVRATNDIAPAPDPRTIAANSMMPNLPPEGPSSEGLSTITGALGYNVFQPRTHAPSTWLPYFGFLSLVLSSIDRILIHTYRFYQNNPDWSPYFTQIYYGIVFIVHILRVRRTAGAISQPESDFLTWFESNFPISSLPIAGPVKHFFQSITVVTGPSKYHGNVYPSFPSITLNGNGNYCHTTNRLNSVLPPIQHLMDRLNDILRGAHAAFTAQDWERYNAAGITHLYGAATTSSLYFGFPGTTDIPLLPSNAMPAFYNSASQLLLPPRLATGAAVGDLTTIAEFCRLATRGTPHGLWFVSVVGMMQRHAQFLKESTNLERIRHKGLGASIPIITISANTHLALPNAAANALIQPTAAQAAIVGPPAHVAIPAGVTCTSRFGHFRVTALSKRIDLHLIAEQFSLLSCVNVSFANVGARGNQMHDLPTDAQLREGPMWAYPDVKEHIEIDVLGQINLFLVGAFHVDTRMVH